MKYFLYCLKHYADFEGRARRLHDTGKSGWLMLIGMIPYVNIITGIVLLVFYCTDSTPGENQYGPNPKGIGNNGNYWGNPNGQGAPYGYQQPYSANPYQQAPYDGGYTQQQ